jgi:hypothetical protein
VLLPQTAAGHLLVERAQQPMPCCFVALHHAAAVSAGPAVGCRWCWPVRRRPRAIRSNIGIVLSCQSCCSIDQRVQAVVLAACCTLVQSGACALCLPFTNSCAVECCCVAFCAPWCSRLVRSNVSSAMLLCFVQWLELRRGLVT